MRSILPITGRALRESVRGLLGWTIGVAAVLGLYLPLFPTFGSNDQLQTIVDTLPPELVNALGYDQIASGPGYTQATFYGLLGFVLLTIAGVAWGAAAIGGAEESGRLELDLAHGIGRVPYALESALAIMLRLLWLTAFAGLVVWLMSEPAELGIEPANILGATLALAGLTAVSAAAALAVGAWTGRKVFGIGAGAGIAVAGYAFNAIANQSADLEWLRVLSPYAWAYHEPPLEGGDPLTISALWLLAVVLVAGAAWGLRRRDVVG